MSEAWENVDSNVIVGPEIDMSKGIVPEEVRRMGIAFTGSLVICKINQEHPRYKENAAVLTAAPELLEALEEADVALTLFAEISGVWDKCSAVELCGNTACKEIGCLCLKRDANRAAIAKAKGAAE